MRKYIKNVVTLIVVIAITITASFSVQAANGGAESKVSPKMCTSSYWYDKSSVDCDAILMTRAQIEKLNKDNLVAEGTNMYDLENMDLTYNADKLRENLSSSIPERDYYVNGVKIDNATYFCKINSSIKNTGYTGENCEIKYAIAVKIADIKAYATDDFLGYSATDTDDEGQNSSLNVNEPFIIKQTCTYDGKTFYYGMSNNCPGWVSAESVAICKDKEEWLDAWQVGVRDKDFIVVTQNKIVLDKSVFTPYSSGVTLNIGTILKLVPYTKIPKKIGERGTWNNYVVYIPTRNSSGMYEKKVALIAEHYDVSVGFLDYTTKNLLDLSFSCLGDRYGWGGMLEAMDCSAYTRNVNRCFGLNIPRNTTWQTKMPGVSVDLSAKSSEEKLEFIQNLPAGTLLYFPGHTMIYVGTNKGESYVVSALGSVVDSKGELEVVSEYSVCLTSLSARRRAGTTWLENLTTAIVPANNVLKVELKKNSLKYTGKKLTPTVKVTDIFGNKIDRASYTVKYKNNTQKGDAIVIVTMKGDYKGRLLKGFTIK